MTGPSDRMFSVDHPGRGERITVAYAFILDESMSGLRIHCYTLRFNLEGRLVVVVIDG